MKVAGTRESYMDFPLNYVCLDLAYGSLRDWNKRLLLFCQSQSVPRLRWLPGQCLSKIFIGKCVRCCSLGQKEMVGVRNIPKKLRKNPGKKILGE